MKSHTIWSNLDVFAHFLPFLIGKRPPPLRSLFGVKVANLKNGKSTSPRKYSFIINIKYLLWGLRVSFYENVHNQPTSVKLLPIDLLLCHYCILIYYCVTTLSIVNIYLRQSSMYIIGSLVSGLEKQIFKFSLNEFIPILKRATNLNYFFAIEENVVRKI